MILPLEKQVCSLESAKRLKELNCPQESLFYWWKVTNTPEEWILVYEKGVGINISAYTVAEIFELLPDAISIPITGRKSSLRVDKWNNQWLVCYGAMDDKNYYPTMVEACAKMLIYLAENGLKQMIKPITIWKRITNNGSTLEVDHNHFDYGHIDGIFPKGHHSWPKYQWMKRFGYLMDCKVY